MPAAQAGYYVYSCVFFLYFGARSPRRPLPHERKWVYFLNHSVSKRIPDIIDCNLKNDHRISIIFGVDISDTTGHQMSIQVPISPNVCICTTWGKRNTRNRR